VKVADTLEVILTFAVRLGRRLTPVHCVLLEIEPGLLVLPSRRVLEIASTVVMADDSTGVTPRDLPLMLARPLLGTIRAASQHFRHCCPGWPDAGGPLYLCV
jgi:hypothetical protein